MPKAPNYCPICGNELNQREEGGRLRPACDHCGYIHYVNPVPGVGMVIEMNGGVVLVQRGAPPHQGVWTLPSGFVEADESAEEAAIREAKEETGLQVEIIEMAGVNSFPEGPPVSGIMIFYRMRPIGGELRAGDDAADVRVFQPHEVPRLPFRTHREMMEEWLAMQDIEWEPSDEEDSPPPLTIRLASVKDSDDLMGLLALIPANRNLTAQDWREVMVRIREVATVDVFVAETTGTSPMIVGCVALSHVRGLTEGVGLINDMAVLPTYQRQGVGAALLEAVMRHGANLNLNSLWVNTQRANDPGRAFYAALGFSMTKIMQLKIR